MADSQDAQSSSDDDAGPLSIATNAAENLNAVQIQQEFFEAMGAADWELYLKKERKFLLHKIAIALWGPPTIEGDLADDDDELKLQGYKLSQEETAMKVFNKICEQAKYSHNGENIIMSLLRVVCLIPKEEVPFYKMTPRDYWLNLHTKTEKDVIMMLFHVFCVRKCISTEPGKNSCRIYIDHDCRVYQDWESYLTENNLPKSVMVVPANGKYRGVIVEDTDGIKNVHDTMPQVVLTVCPSPALGIGARVLNVADRASLVANVGALAGVVGALAIPAVAPVLAGAAIGVGVVTGVYGIVRASIHLADRSKHEQSIGLEDGEARSSWINIVVSTVGISSSAATKLLSEAAASGANLNTHTSVLFVGIDVDIQVQFQELSCYGGIRVTVDSAHNTEVCADQNIYMRAFNILKYASIGTGAFGIANSLGEMIYKYMKYEETPTKLELFQFTSSVLFFGIGVMSNQTAQDIVQDVQARTINEYRDSLSSNNQRRLFDKVTAETRRLEGTINGNNDVIRALKIIDDKDDFFLKLGRINKQAKSNKVRISLSSDGSTVINNQHKFSLSELYGLGKEGRSQLFSEYGPAKVTTKNAPTRIYASNVSANGINVKDTVTRYICPEAILKITTFLLRLTEEDQNFLEEILSELSYKLHDAFLLLCVELLASLVPEQIKRIGGPIFKVLFIFVFNYLKSKLGECDVDNDNAIKIIVKKFIVDGGIDTDTIRVLKKRLLNWLSDNKYNGLNGYDYIYKFRKTRKNGYMILRAGEVTEIGEHKVLVKGITVQKLEEWLESHTQKICDLFMAFCFKVISLFSQAEIYRLSLVNLDEDVILRVAEYLVNVNIIEQFNENTELDYSLCIRVKADIMSLRSTRHIRKHRKCVVCKGVRYIS